MKRFTDRGRCQVVRGLIDWHDVHVNPVKSMIMIQRLASIPFFLLICSLIALPAVLSARENAAAGVAIEVGEQVGTPVDNRFVRVGVPFPEGALDQTNRLRLEDADGRAHAVQTEVLKRYASGDVHWVSVAFVPELDAGQRREFRLIDAGESAAPEAPSRAGETREGWVLENEHVRATIGDAGLEQLYFREVPLLGDAGARPVVVTGDGERQDWETREVEVLADGEVYTTVRVTGELLPLGMEAEWQLSLTAGAKHLEQELRLISKSDVVLHTAGLMISFAPEISFEDEDDGVATGTSLGLVHRDNGSGLLLHAPDIDRFRGAVEREDDAGAPANGWVKRTASDGPQVLYAPIQYRAPWTWYDGVSRTTRLDLFLGDGLENDLPAASERPAVHVETRQFLESGVLPAAGLPPSARRAYAWLMGAADARDGHFEAGMLPQQITYAEDGSVRTGGSQSRPGETVYNLWYVHMQTQDPVLRRMLMEDAESWADVVVYRGSDAFLTGADRYGSGSQYGTFRFHTSHPYYGDSSGMYLTYLMTGDPYYRETFERMVDHSTEAAFRHTNSGDFHVPRRFTWDGGDVQPRPFIESRNILQARPLSYAEAMFGERDYLRIVGQIGAWARHTQHEKGFWYQAYYDDGEPLTQRALDLPSAKNYIMLYGVRGLVSAYDHLARKDAGEELDAEAAEWRDTIAETLLVFSDYLLDEQQEHGWLWDPISEGGDYAAHTNEDMRRGQMPRQEIMAIEVLEGAYRISGDERYLTGMLEMLRYYVSIQQKQGGWSSRNQHREHEDGTVQGPFLGNNTAQFLRILPSLQAFFDREGDKVRSLGFRDLPAVLSSEASDIRDRFSHGFSDEEVGFNAFATGIGQVIYLANFSGWRTGEWTKQVDLHVTGESKLYAGAKNRISAEGTRLAGELEQFERLYGHELPVRLDPNGNELLAEVARYSVDEISLDLQAGGAVGFEIEDGDFRVGEGTVYLLSIDGEPHRRVQASGGTLRFEVEQDGDYRLSVTRLD